MAELNYKRGIDIATARAGTNAKAVAKKIGIPLVTMYTYTRNSARMPLATAVKIADACNVSIQDFVDYMKETENA